MLERFIYQMGKWCHNMLWEFFMSYIEIEFRWFDCLTGSCSSIIVSISSTSTGNYHGLCWILSQRFVALWLGWARTTPTTNRREKCVKFASNIRRIFYLSVSNFYIKLNIRFLCIVYGVPYRIRNIFGRENLFRTSYDSLGHLSVKIFFFYNFE